MMSTAMVRTCDGLRRELVGGTFYVAAAEYSVDLHIFKIGGVTFLYFPSRNPFAIFQKFGRADIITSETFFTKPHTAFQTSWPPDCAANENGENGMNSVWKGRRQSKSYV
jgi:hypothetical protein